MRKHNYLIGFRGGADIAEDGSGEIVELMTLSEAKETLKYLNTTAVFIYKLVKVKENKNAKA